MSQFSDSLSSAIKRTGRTYEEVATEAGISRPTLSNFALGKRTPEPEILDSIIKLLPAQDRYEVAIAYLREHIPPSTPEIQLTTKGKEPDADDLSKVLMDLPPSWRPIVAAVVARALKRNNLEALKALAGW